MTESIVPGYRIIEEIGRGGMAVVSLAVQESLERRVALKVMSPMLALADPSYGNRFLKEGRTVAQLRHPGIVQVYDIGTSAGSYYMAMEYLSGGDLAGKIKQGLSETKALDVLRQLAEALAYAHGKGYVHRDIKPENVLFDEDGRAVLTDFGIARAMRAGTRITRAGMTIGTPQYMSPEQARAKTLDGRTDLYSLGILLFEMLTGNVPYDAEDTYVVGIKHINDPLPVLPEHLSRYQPLLDHLLAKDPDDRFADAGVLLYALDTIAQGGQIPDGIQHKLRKKQIFHRMSGQPGLYWGLGGALLAIALLAGIGFGTHIPWPSGQVVVNGPPPPPPVEPVDTTFQEHLSAALEEAARVAELERERRAQEESARQAALEQQQREEQERQRATREQQRREEQERQRAAQEESARQADLEQQRREEQERQRAAREQQRREEQERQRAAQEESARQAALEQQQREEQERLRAAREQAAAQEARERERREEQDRQQRIAEAERQAVAVDADARQRAQFVVAPSGGDYRSIQDAIEAARPGATILIRPGTYRESIVMEKKEVHLIGDGPRDRIIVESTNDSAVYFNAPRGTVRNMTLRIASSRIDRFTVSITGGELLLEGCDITSTSHAPVGVGGRQANPTIRGNRIRDGADHGIFVYDNGRGLFENNQIFGHAKSGIVVKTGGNPTVRGNIIRNNRADGVNIVEKGRGVFERNEIFGNNYANVTVWQEGDAVFRGNTIRDGRTDGVWIHDNGKGLFENNNITGNAYFGVRVNSRNSSTFRNNQITSNGYQAVMVDGNASGVFESNDLRDNARGPWMLAANARAERRNNRE